MSNIIEVKQPKKTIDLGDGVEREVTFSLNAMAELELKYGSLDEAFEKLQDGSIATIRYLLWLVLVPEGDDDLTEKQVGALIKIDNLNEIMDSLMTLFNESMPESTQDPNQVAQPKKEW